MSLCNKSSIKLEKLKKAYRTYITPSFTTLAVNRTRGTALLLAQEASAIKEKKKKKDYAETENQTSSSWHFKVDQCPCSVQEDKHKPQNGQKILRYA